MMEPPDEYEAIEEAIPRSQRGMVFCQMLEEIANEKKEEEEKAAPPVKRPPRQGVDVRWRQGPKPVEDGSKLPVIPSDRVIKTSALPSHPQVAPNFLDPASSTPAVASTAASPMSSPSAPKRMHLSVVLPSGEAVVERAALDVNSSASALFMLVEASVGKRPSRLARVSGGMLDSASTLRSSGVVDGETLVAVFTTLTRLFSTALAFAAVKEGGGVTTWGHPASGGDSSAVSRDIAEGVIGIYSNERSFAALKQNGSIITWGDQESGGSCDMVREQLSCNVQSVSSTRSAFAALRGDGSVITWGAASAGGNSFNVRHKLNKDVLQVCATRSAFAAIRTDGSVVAWGNPEGGGDSSAVKNALTAAVIRIYAADKAFAALKADGSVVTWGAPSEGGDSYGVRADLASGVETVCATRGAFSALKDNGSVVCWGNPSGGGDSRKVAKDLRGNVKSIHATKMAFAAVKVDGTVVAWGHPNCGGSVGASKSNVRGIPGSKEPSLADVVHIYSAESAFVALTYSGHVVTWGDASVGGDCSAVQRQLVDVVRIYSTRAAFAALTKGGAVITWGSSVCGGDCSSVYDQLQDGIQNICATSFAFAAVKSSGSIVTWGSNGSDQHTIYPADDEEDPGLNSGAADPEVQQPHNSNHFPPSILTPVSTASPASPAAESSDSSPSSNTQPRRPAHRPQGGADPKQTRRPVPGAGAPVPAKPDHAASATLAGNKASAKARPPAAAVADKATVAERSEAFWANVEAELSSTSQPKGGSSGTLRGAARPSAKRAAAR